MSESPVVELRIATPEDMEALGAAIARQLGPGDLVLLNGELGAGKTTLTRGLGAQLGVRGAVTSPTFVLARTHPREGGAPLVHVDAYRLASAVELDDLDLDYARSIVVIEWGAGLLDGLTEDWLELDIVRWTPSTPSATTVPEPVDGVDGFEGSSSDDDGSDADFDGPEPRFITVTGHGARWKDLGWVGAPRN